MKITKRIVATFVCLILVIVCSFTVAAADTPRISLSNVRALPGESVTINISISNNPGIMAMSFCITYDNEAFEYTGYSKGYLSRYTIKDHSDKGQIAFVNDEASNKSNDGVMLSVKFRVKDNAAPGKHTITLANQNREKYGTKLHNSFSNSNLKYIVPSVTAGSITVGATCENSGHKYGGWTVVTPADCVSTGTKEHTCLRCDHTETADIPITHDFEAEWTVDKAATPTEDGTMSRHCKNCDAVTDEITFTYEEVEDSQKPDDDASSEDSVSSEEASGDNSSSNVSDEYNSSNSDNSSSQNSTSSDNASSNANSNSSDSASNKTPINNTVGAKNPQSAVENIKDYQENIKPNINASSDAQSENTSSKDDTVSDSESAATDTGGSEPTDTGDFSNTETNLSVGNIALFAVSGVISIAIIALAIILILKRKKENEE
jgi:hypothetical protein